MPRDLPREQLHSTSLITEKNPRIGRDGAFPALDPLHGGQWALRVTPRFLERCRLVSEGELKTLAHTVPQACLQPTRIYQGVRDEAAHEWLCYCSLPLTRFNRHGVEVATGESDIFLVFVNEDRRIYEFRWEITDQPDSGIPKDAEKRFLRRVYP